MPLVTSGDSNRCPECGGQVVLDDKRGELTCQVCGLVVEGGIVDAYPEVVNERMEREEPVKDRILPQFIFGSRDAHGRPVSERFRWQRRRTAEVFNLTSQDRHRLRMTREISQICATSGLPSDIGDRAFFIYKRVVSADPPIIVKPSMRDLALACIIAACRERKVFVDIQRLCNNKILTRRSALRYCHLISRRLVLESSGLKKARAESQEGTAEERTERMAAFVNDTSPTDSYVSKFVNDLGETREVQTEATRIVRLQPKLNVNPKCVAAAAVYLACLNLGSKKTQRQVKDVTGTSEVTIRTWAARLKKVEGVVTASPAVGEDDDFSDVQE